MTIQTPSPNFTKGRDGFNPEKIIIHIMDGTLTGTDKWFISDSQKAGTPVSAHFGIGYNGEEHQYVQEEDTAYAQGLVDNPSWNYRPGVNPNKYCLSIENEGFDLSIIHQPQIDALIKRIKILAAKYNIQIDRQHIQGHYEIRASKPNCPATNKSILDTIVKMARENQPVVQDNIAVANQIIALAKTIK